MSADRTYPAPFDTSTFILPAEWQTLADIFGGAQTGLLFQENGVIVHINPTLAKQLGFAGPELIGMPVETLFADGNGVSQADGQGCIRLKSKSGATLDYDMVLNRIDPLTNASRTVWVLQPVRRSGTGDASAPDTRVQVIADHLPDLVFTCTPDTVLTYASKSFHEVLGYDASELTGVRLLDMVHQEDRRRLTEALQSVQRQDSLTFSSAATFRMRHRDGSWKFVSAQARNLLSNEAVAAILLNGQDVTQVHLQQQSLAVEKKRQLHYMNRLLRMALRPHANMSSALKVIVKSAAKALGTHRCAFWQVDDEPAATRCVVAYDDARQNFVAEELDTLFSTAFHPLLLQVLRSEHQLVVADVDQDPRAALYCEYFHARRIKAIMIVPVQRGEKIAGLLVFSHYEQARPWRKDEAEFGQNAAGLATLIFNEVERERTEAQLRHLAHHDSLTGLPNRHFLFDQAGDIFPAITSKANSLAAFFIDLDGFKNVNDSLGHAMGDELLKAAALRLKNVVRKDDILVRLGGDEFMLLARNLSDMRIADDIAMQIVDTMRGTFSLQGRELQISASVGIAIYPFDGTDIETLMKKADIAMYQAKSAGRDQYRMFEPKLSEGMINRSAVESELRRAIEEHELMLYYQPQIDLRSGEVRCVEALLRWRHPQHGMLLPSSFLPMAEESGLIRAISAWVIHSACEQLSKWSKRGMDGFNMAVNLSACQLMDRALLAELEDAMDRHGIPGHRLEWEIKESTVMRHNTMTSLMLDRMSDMHVGLCIDDFGTGYSNMAYLRRYPVRKVKIDISFVKGLLGSEDERAVADAIISMAKPLGLDVVAEGVESAPQVDYLRDHGCNIAQGYFFTQPLTPDQFETWLTRH